MRSYLFCVVFLGLIFIVHGAAALKLAEEHQNLDAETGQRRRNNNNRTHISQDERALGSFLQRVAVGRAIVCQSDADCSKGGKNKCLADNLHLCGRQSVAAIFQAADDTACTADTDCKSLAGSRKLAYRCAGGKCDFCGPRVCQTDADCCTSGQGDSQKCAKIPGYADYRCWKSCTKNEDCHVRPGPVKGKVACLEGVCQKRGRRPKTV